MKISKEWQSELDCEFTGKKYATAKKNNMLTWMRILSAEDPPLCELVELVETEAYVGPHGEKPEHVLKFLSVL
jgi:hypothetical protein